jgi:hypothetical protein
MTPVKNILVQECFEGKIKGAGPEEASTSTEPLSNPAIGGPGMPKLQSTLETPVSPRSNTLSKKLRFEIFKRDSFTCQYCGRRPPEIVLEVDHINPRANGGDDDILNLITACFACNRGKAATRLEHKAIRPDADLEFLACQQELAEVKRFLDARELLVQTRAKAVAAIQDHWGQTLNTDDLVPADKVVIGWMLRYSPEEICRSIDLAIPAVQARPWGFKKFDDYLKYVSGILRNRREQAETL